jgi:type I restriction enzyme, R subunit
MSALNESTVEDAALTWFGEVGYPVAHGPDIAPGQPAAERDTFGDVVLVGRLRDAIQRLNPTIPEEAREEALRKAQGTAGRLPFAHANQPDLSRHVARGV